ncbi:MAG: ExbD/TolR family protein [Paracoccaceae bacterium]
MSLPATGGDALGGGLSALAGATPAVRESGVIDLGPPTRRRRIGLTPLIDIVFLILVFFMLAARFGIDRVIPLDTAGSTGGTYAGAPRLVTVSRDGLALNGQPMAFSTLVETLRPLMPRSDAPVVIRARPEADLQALVDVLDGLRASGFPTLVLVE